jgi:hypothetical protein
MTAIRHVAVCAKGIPPMPFSRLVPLVLALALAGCGSIGAVGPFGHSNPPQNQTTMGGLPQGDTPQGTVVTSTPANQTQAVTSEPIPDPSATASADPAAAGSAPAAPAASGGGAGGLSRTDLLGGWTISAGGDSCQLFMTLTSWTGGYRASTRGCNNEQLKSISAWNLEGRQVVLAGTGGTPVARLSSSGNGRFNGTTGGGAAVSFYR